MPFVGLSINMKTIILACGVAAILLAADAVVSAQGRSSGRGGGSGAGPAPATPPGLERRVVQVAEPATLTLLGFAVGGGWVARQFASRRQARRRS